MLKNSPGNPTMCSLPPIKCFSYVKTFTIIEDFFGDDDKKWPSVIKELKDEEKDLAINALGMSIAFLIDALIEE